MLLQQLITEEQDYKDLRFFKAHLVGNHSRVSASYLVGKAKSLPVLALPAQCDL